MATKERDQCIPSRWHFEVREDSGPRNKEMNDHDPNEQKTIYSRL